MKKIKKLSLAETLRAMQEGDEVAFSMREVASSTIRNATWRIQKADGWKYSVRQASRELKTYVIRIQ